MERVRQLLDEGAEPGRASLYQLTPLMVATYGGNRELVELLLARGAPIGDVDNSGKSALVYAAARHNARHNARCAACAHCRRFVIGYRPFRGVRHPMGHTQ